MRRLLIALTLLAVGACSSGGGADKDVASLGDATKTGSDQPTQKKDREQAWLDFAACMREHGVDMPDPEVSDTGVMVRAERAERAAGPPEAAVEDEHDEAHEACRHHIEGLDGGPREAPDPEMQDRMVKFAECMREQGIDMPDPSVDGGRVALRVGKGDREKIDAAHKACESLAPFKAGGNVEPAK